MLPKFIARLDASKFTARLKAGRTWLLVALAASVCWVLPQCLPSEASLSLVPDAGQGLNHPPTLREFMVFGVYQRQNILCVVAESARLTLTLSLVALAIGAACGAGLIFMDFAPATRAFTHPFLGMATYCPRLLILIALSASLALSRPSQLPYEVSSYLVILLGGTGAIFLASQTAGEVAEVRSQLYVQFASSLGIPIWTIFVRHVLRNCVSIPLTVTKQFRDNVLFLSTLSFIGLVHLQQPADFGAVIYKYASDPEVFHKAWWALFFPCATLAGIILLCDLVAEKISRQIEKEPTVPRL